MRLNLARYWITQGHFVSVIALYKTGALLDEYINVVGATNVFFLLAPNARQVTCIFPLARLLRLISPDIVLVSCWPLTVYSLVTCLLVFSNAKLIVSEHTSIFHTFRCELRLPLWLFVISATLFYARADAIVAVSKGISCQLGKLLPLYSKKIFTVYNPAYYEPSQAFVFPEKLREFAPSWGSKIILAVGELKEQKNFALLIQSMAHLRDSEAILVIVGEGSERNALERLIISLGLSEKVFLPGYSSQVSQWYRIANVFVLSSGWEGFANVIVEALSHGVTTVSTDCLSGPSEILSDGEYGLLVPLDNPLLMADAIDEALIKPFPPDFLIARARAFSVQKIADQYLSLVCCS